LRFVYPYTVRRSGDGAWQVRFPDVPESMTAGDAKDEARALAEDALLAALGGYGKLKRDLPVPSRQRAGQFVVAVPMLQSAKLALYQAMREAKLSNVTLARKLGKHEGEVRRMLDLDHETKIAALESALLRLGRQVAIEVRRAA
jgi:antitoxin HicB